MFTVRKEQFTYMCFDETVLRNSRREASSATLSSGELLVGERDNLQKKYHLGGGRRLLFEIILKIMGLNNGVTLKYFIMS